MGTSARTGRPIWERSLYWKIVLGFGACIAGVLAVQTTAVLVLLRSIPDSQRLNAFTHDVAADLSAALEADPDLDGERYFDRRYAKPRASLLRDLVRHN